MDQPSLGQLVRDYRRAAGLTQEELAARAKLSTRAISDLERGVNHTPRATTVQLLVAALGLSDREREHFDAAARALGEHTSKAATSLCPPREQSPTSGANTLTPLIGRASELTSIRQHLAGQGPPLLLIAGEPGIGKTRLLQEAAVLGSRLGLNVLRGSVPSSGDADSLDPLADALRNALQGRSPVFLRRVLQGCASLAKVLPELTSWDLPAAELPQEAVNAAVAAGSVLRFIANTAGPAGTLLTLDNLQDAAVPGLALLARVVRSSNDLPVRIVAAYRDGHCTGRDPLTAVLAQLAHEQLLRHTRLSHLSTREAADLLTARALQWGKPIDPWPARALHDSGGVPYYVVAWAEHLEAARRQAALAAIPWPIEQSVRFRMQAGPAAVRPVLEVLAGIGGRATHAVLTDVVGLPTRETQAAIDWGLAERLIDEDDQAYAFAYGVVQTAVESALSLTRRQVIRRRLATVVKRHGGTQTAATDHGRAYHLAVLRHGRRTGSQED